MKNKKGFTFMEVMVVVLIIAMLAAFAYPTYTKVIMKARIADAFSLAGIVREAQQRYFVVNGVGAYFPEFTNSHINGRTRLVKTEGVTVDGGQLIKKDRYYVYITNKGGEEPVTNGCINVEYKQNNAMLFKITTHVEDSKIWCEEGEGITGICNTIPSLETEATDCD
ncbi:MAG: prepilin-type N-terminal cleavage/methylation domain-containing protein [Elusimicrobiaceae bacterium]|nr:prepilin-type N-terminal cleavage/methylation domain-containing protein [Elusimicrobiaceae bacterium]